ncbi:hypothetical protein [Halostreptopolyspora alba]|uniref:hypothetical protein n=1 Tax=Halostreptopolyspora alba TaxID=2487137 RepID=UPI0026A5F288
MTPEQRRQVLAEIAREELQRLVYGEITCEADRARLAELARAAGVELDAVLPASGDPGHDPRTGVVNPRADQPDEEEPAPETEPTEIEAEDPDLDPEVVDLVTAIDAALAEATTGEPVEVPAWSRMALAEEVSRLAQRSPRGAHCLVGVLEHHQIRTGALL